MSNTDEVLRRTNSPGLIFRCPGCKTCHHIRVEADDGPCWLWDKDMYKPTITPSILTRWTKLLVSDTEARTLAAVDLPIPREDVLCHLYITNGILIYLDDCTQALRGKNIDMVKIND